MVFSILFINLMNSIDNKYSKNLSNEQIVLKNNWELYPDKLYTPKQLQSSSLAYKKTFIGKYGNLSFFHEDGSTFKDLTLRTYVDNTFNEEALTLYIQEPICAMRVYINGNLLHQNGKFEPYRPFIKNTIITFPAEEKNEIVIQCRNYSHYITGIYYPPILASIETIQELLIKHFIFNVFICFTSTTLTLYCFILWYPKRKEKKYAVTRDLGIMALAFSYYITYTFKNAIGIKWITLHYTLKTTSEMICIWMMISILLTLANKQKSKLGKSVHIFNIILCIISIITPSLLLHLPLSVINYSVFLSYGRLINAILCLGLSYYVLYSKQNSLWIIPACIFNALMNTYEILSMDQFEPLQYGRFTEYGFYIMILCFAYISIRYNHKLIIENEKLKDHLHDEVNKQFIEIHKLLKDRKNMIQELLHDLKAPLSSSYLYLQLIQDNDIQMDEQTKKHIQIMNQNMIDMNENLIMMQKINNEQDIYDFQIKDIRKCIHQFYNNHLDELKNTRRFIISLPNEECLCLFDEKQVMRIFENLLNNALDYTKNNDVIKIKVDLDKYNIIIQFCDSGKGIPQENIEHLFDKNFTTGNQNNHEGLGLPIIKNIVIQHNGSIKVNSKLRQGTIFSIYFPRNKNYTT